MAEQAVDFFDYIIEDKRSVLLNKIEYIDEKFDDFKKQKAFNKRLDKELTRIEVGHKNLSYSQLSSLLNQNKLVVKAYKLKT